MNFSFAYLPSKEKLTASEHSELKSSFPNIKTTSTEKLGYHNQGIPSDNSNIPTLCQQFGCDITTQRIGEYTDPITGEKHVIIIDNSKLPLCLTQFTCIDVKYYHLKYNCIGWALGIRDWINPVNAKGKAVLNTEASLNSFLNELKVKYPNNHSKNALKILDKVHIKPGGCANNDVTKDKSDLSLNDNTVLFYFTNKLTHAARYVESIDNTAINSLTSKLGQSWLISHDTEDLSDSSPKAAYGLPKCISYEEREHSWQDNVEEWGVYIGYGAFFATMFLVYNFCEKSFPHTLPYID